MNEYAIKDVKPNIINSPLKDKHKEPQVSAIQQGDGVNNNGIRRTYKGTYWITQRFLVHYQILQSLLPIQLLLFQLLRQQ